jgi:hypothetical protein
MKTIIIVLCMLATTSANAITCRSEKGDGSGWSWRQIDGKRCWYKGEKGTDKKLLRWPIPAPTVPKVRTVKTTREPVTPPPPLPTTTAEDELLLESYWPSFPIPAPANFDSRFDAVKQPPARWEIPR